MNLNLPCNCDSPDHHGQPTHQYFVTVADTGRGLVKKVSGPFDTHREAMADVRRVRAWVMDVDPRGPWYLYGTAGEAR